MQNWREQDAGDLEPNASPAFAAAAVGAAGRVLPVEERQAKAKEDIAAAKARQAAFAGQGSRQFTDVDIAKPGSPDISSKSERFFSSATATMALDDAQMPSASQLPGSGRSEPSSQPAEGSATGTFVLDKNDNEEPTDGSATETFELGQGGNLAEDDNPTDTFMLESDICQGSSGNNQDSSGRSRQPSVYEPDTSKPLYAKGRADLKPHAADEQNARQAAEAQLKAKSQQTITPDVSAADAVKKHKAEQSAAEQSMAEQSPAESDGGQSDTGKPASVFEPDTSKPLYTKGRADLKPRAADEQNARRAAEAELKAKSQQTITPDVSAADAVKKFKAERSADEQSPAESETGKADATAPAELASTSAGQQSSSLGGASSKPIAGGRAPAGEHDAREKAMAELKAKSQQQQPVTGVSSRLTASDKQQGAASQQQKPMSDQRLTSDLATSLSGASMSAKPEPAPSDQAVTAAPRSPPQTRPLQAQQAASLTPSATSSASSFAPSQQEVQNPLQGLLSAFQGLLGGQSKSTATSSTTSSGSFGVGAEQARLVPLTAAQQAELSPADASASQRMAASNQALAAGKVCLNIHHLTLVQSKQSHCFHTQLCPCILYPVWTFTPSYGGSGNHIPKDALSCLVLTVIEQVQSCHLWCMCRGSLGLRGKYL